MQQEGVEFLRRFCQHIMPKQFFRIRRSGTYNHTTKRRLAFQFGPGVSPVILKLEKCDGSETKQERIRRLTGFDISQCKAIEKAFRGKTECLEALKPAKK